MRQPRLLQAMRQALRNRFKAEGDTATKQRGAGPYRFRGPHPCETGEPELFQLARPSPMLEYWVASDDPNSEVFHASDGPAVIRENGDRSFYEDGEKHRWDGPAETGVEGYAAYYRRGRLHRLDGPAILCPHGRELVPAGEQYWIDGHRYSPSEHAVLSRLIRDDGMEGTERLDNPSTAAAEWEALRTEFEREL